MLGGRQAQSSHLDGHEDAAHSIDGEHDDDPIGHALRKPGHETSQRARERILNQQSHEPGKMPGIGREMTLAEGQERTDALGYIESV